MSSTKQTTIIFIILMVPIVSFVAYKGITNAYNKADVEVVFNPDYISGTSEIIVKNKSDGRLLMIRYPNNLKRRVSVKGENDGAIVKVKGEDDHVDIFTPSYGKIYTIEKWKRIHVLIHGQEIQQVDAAGTP